MSVRQRRPRDEADRRYFPKILDESSISRVFEMIANFQSSSVQYLRLLIDARVAQMTRLRETSVKYENKDVVTQLTQTKDFSDIQQLLLTSSASSVCEIPLHLIPDQVAMVFTQSKSAFGSKICFAVFIKSLPLLAEFILTDENVQIAKTDKILANQAIKFLLNSPLPPMFYPDIQSQVIMSVELNGIKPVSTTSVALTQSMMYVGCEGPMIRAIPLQRTQQREVEDIPLPDMPDEPYSLVVHKGMLIISSSSEPALMISPRDKSVTKIPVSYGGNVFMMMHKFTPPIVSDGQLLYSIGYNDGRVKTFKLEEDEVVFVSVVKLSAPDGTLAPPFTELLPVSQRNTCSIATNGVYIGFLFEAEECTICRIFLLRDGVHQHDVVLHGVSNIDSWCFDGFRPAHCVVQNGKGLFFDNRYTLPKWLIGFEDPNENPKVSFNRQSEIVTAVSEALAVFASRTLGSEVHLHMALNDQYYKGSMEKCILKFIDQNNRYATQAFLAFLGMRMRQNRNDFCSHGLFQKLCECYCDPNYQYLHKQIVFTFLSALDMFCRVDCQATSDMLFKIIQSNEYMNLLCKYLPKARNLAQTLTKDSLKLLCTVTLKTTFVYDEEAISLLTELQYLFIANGNQYTAPLLVVYAIELYYQLEDDHQKMIDGEWTPKQFVNSVSFTVFQELVQLACATSENLHLNSKLGSCFFRVSLMEKPPPCPESFTIEKLFLESFFVSILVFLNLIRNDKYFYHFAAKSRRRMSDLQAVEKDNITSDEIDGCGVSDELKQGVIAAANGCCCENVDRKVMIEQIQHLFYLVKSGQTTETAVLAKCTEVKRIQPQLFANVFHFLAGTDELHVVEEPSKCYAIKFIMLFDQKLSNEMIATMGFFLDEINEIREHFVVLPSEYLCRLLRVFHLRFYLPTCLFPSSFCFSSSLVTDMSFEMLRECLDSVLAVANRIDDPDKLRLDLGSYDVPMLPTEEILKVVIFMRVALRCGACVTPCDAFFIQSIQIGDYEIAYHVVEAVKVMATRSKYDVSNTIAFMFTCIGGFLSGEMNLFLSKDDSSGGYRVVMLMCQFLRVLARQQNVCLREVIERLHSNSDFLALFAVFNTKIDVVRPHVRVSFEDSQGIILEGCVRSVSQSGFDLDSREYFEFAQVRHLKVLPDEPLNSDFIRELSQVFKKAFLEFHEVNPFKYACLCDLLVIDTVRSLFSYEEIDSLCLSQSRVDINVSDLLLDMNQTWGLRIATMTFFSFDTENVPCEPVTDVDTSIFGKVPINMTYNMLSTEEKSEHFTSTTVNPHSYSELSLQSHTHESHFTLMIHALSKEFAFHSTNFAIQRECSVKTCPKTRTIEVTQDGVVTIYRLSPRCDLLYYSLELPESSILEYTFRGAAKYEPAESLGRGELFDIDNYVESLPYRMSSQWRDTFIQELYFVISQNFMVTAFREYLHGMISNSNWVDVTPDNASHIAKLLLNILSPVAHESFVRLADYENVLSPEEFEFLNVFLSEIRHRDRDRTLLVEALLNSITRNKVTTISEANNSALILRCLDNVCLPDGYYFTETSCSHEPPELETVIWTPSNETAGTAVEFACQISHVITFLIELCTSYDEFYKAMTKVHEVICSVVAAEPLKKIAEDFIPEKRPQSENEVRLQNLLPDFYNRNSIFVDCSETMFMFLRSNFYAFPLSFWLLCVIESPSFSVPLVPLSESVAEFTTDSDIYSVFQFSSPCPDSVFDISASSSFDDILTSVRSNSPFITSHKPLYVRARQALANAKLYSHPLVVEKVEPTIRGEVFKWSTNHSHQLVLGFLNEARSAPLLLEDWELLPLSSIFSFETVSVFAQVLRNDVSGSFSNHTLRYDHGDVLEDDARLAVFRSIFPEFANASLIELLFEENLSDVEKAGVLALAFQKRLEIPFAVPSCLWRSIADSHKRSRVRSIFLAVTGLPRNAEFSPVYVRYRTCFSPLSSSELVSLFLWRDVDASTQSLLLAIIDHMCSYVRSLFLEWITGHCSVSAARHSSRSSIIVIGTTTPNILECHPGAGSLVVGQFSDQKLLAKALMVALQSFLDTTYC